ncbi:MAG: hypothetical protein U0Q22_13820 [Acidimicrobiales bacterium]
MTTAFGGALVRSPRAARNEPIMTASTIEAPPVAEDATVVARPPRLTSLDLLRGLSVAVMVLVNVPGDRGLHPAQLVHADWAGFRVAETVFPGFVIAAGGAVALSSRSATLGPTLVRAARIFVVGLLLVWLKYHSIGFKTGTLQFIAMAWLVAALLSRLTPSRRTVAALSLMGVVAVLHLLPWLPGATGWGIDGLDAHIDAPLFGGRSDLGVLGMLSAGALAALASVVVATVRSSSHRRRVVVFGATAVGALAACLVLRAVGVPVVKRVWSPSYLFAGASVSFLVLAVGEAIAATRVRRVLTPLLALGTNALPLYVLATLISLAWTSAWRQSTTAWLTDLGLSSSRSSLVVSGVVLAVVVAVAMWLRRTGRVIRL